MKNLVHIFHVFLFSIFLLFVGKSVFAESNKLNDRDSVEMITIPEGYFLMGSKAGEGRPDERPQNKIYLDSYEIDVNEVSNKRYLNFIKKTNRKGHFIPLIG